MRSILSFIFVSILLGCSPSGRIPVTELGTTTSAFETSSFARPRGIFTEAGGEIRIWISNEVTNTGPETSDIYSVANPDAGGTYSLVSADAGVTWNKTPEQTGFYPKALVQLTNGTWVSAGTKINTTRFASGRRVAGSTFFSLASTLLSLTELLDFDIEGSEDERYCEGISADSSNVLYAACSTETYEISPTESSNTLNGLIYKSTDMGSSWNLVDTVLSETPYSYSPNHTYAKDVIALPGNIVLVSAIDFRALNENGLWIRRSTDAGTTWTTVSSDATTLTAFNSPRLITKNGTDIFHIAQGNKTVNLQSNWTSIIQKSADTGATWTLLADGLTGASGFPQNFNAEDLGVDSSGNIFVVGWDYKLFTDSTFTGTEYNRYRKWRIIKSTDGGVTWTTIDTLGVTKSYGAYDIEITPSDVIVVAGAKKTEVEGALHNLKPLVRRSVDAGLTWTTVLE